MLRKPFLTELDPQAGVKGSVDPMGATPIWSRMGRRVVGNLTTASDSVNGFKTLVLGFAAIEHFQRQAGPKEDVDELGVFLRWEQVAAYVRARFNRDYAFRGTTRVRDRLKEGAVVPIGRNSSAQILGNQKIYGLWGLFSVPGRSSGLLDAAGSRTTETTRAWMSSRLPPLKDAWSAAMRHVGEDQRRVNLDAPGRAESFKRLARIWGPVEPRERAFWTDHLLHGGPDDPTHGRQRLLVELLADTLKDEAFEWSIPRVRALAKAARKRDDVLAHHLDGIAACESVLAPAVSVFALMQARDRQKTSAVAAELRKAWGASVDTVDVEGFQLLRPQLADASGDTLATFWFNLAQDLRAGHYAEVVHAVLQINAEVMKGRGGAPWVTEEGGTLRVRFRDDKTRLPTRRDLRDLWRNPYFLESLRKVTKELAA